MVLWSFHFLVHLLLCCYAIHSCWCTPMTFGHAFLVSVSISQRWQLSMKLFFRFSSLLFPIVCNTYSRRDWMPSCLRERVYALWCFSVAFGMLHILWYQPSFNSLQIYISTSTPSDPTRLEYEQKHQSRTKTNPRSCHCKISLAPTVTSQRLHQADVVTIGLITTSKSHSTKQRQLTRPNADPKPTSEQPEQTTNNQHQRNTTTPVTV